VEEPRDKKKERGKKGTKEGKKIHESNTTKHG